MTAVFWIFWICALLLLHHHVFFPLSLLLAGRLVRRQPTSSNSGKDLPQLSLLLAVHNEEPVLPQKLLTTFQTDYPAERLEVLIGSDVSTDGTDALLEQAGRQYPGLRWFRMPERSGKAAVINFLARQARGEILVLTDANVMFTPQTLRCLVQPFGDPSVGLVGGNIISRGDSSSIGPQESLYQRYENLLKYYEGKLWGVMMGAFGGCYAIRRALYEPVPAQIIVDDFYITLAVLRRGMKAVAEPQARCYEEVRHATAEEFRRKSRIATGNYQMLRRYGYLLWPGYGALAYVFFSHKVLRWLAPHLMIALYLSSFALASVNKLYLWLALFFTLILLSPLVVWAAGKLGMRLPGLRFLSHYVLMNAAMLYGFFRFLTGVKHHVWQPTQRT